jgi:hypothetical protein
VARTTKTRPATEIVYASQSFAGELDDGTVASILRGNQYRRSDAAVGKWPHFFCDTELELQETPAITTPLEPPPAPPRPDARVGELPRPVHPRRLIRDIVVGTVYGTRHEFEAGELFADDSEIVRRYPTLFVEVQ